MDCEFRDGCGRAPIAYVGYVALDREGREIGDKSYWATTCSTHAGDVWHDTHVRFDEKYGSAQARAAKSQVIPF